MNKNKKIIYGVVGVVVLVAVFYGGVVYGKSHATTSRTAGTFTRGAGRGMGEFGGGAGGTQNFTTGSIISKNDKSMTVSIMGGGSKIIFFDANTKVSIQPRTEENKLATIAKIYTVDKGLFDGAIGRVPLLK